MKSPNLMLHCGADEVRRTDLANVVLPATTETYHPIGHNVFADLVEERLANIGFHFGAQAHAMTHDGARYFGLVELLCGNENEQYALVMGIRNSLDKRFPAMLGFGSQVFVCDNLAFSAEIKVSRKHTKYIMRDLPKLVDSAISHTTLMKENQEARYDSYMETRLTSRQADHVICDMIRRNAIQSSRAGAVLNEWDTPSEDQGPNTAWRLFNAATRVLKADKLHNIPPRTVALHGLMDEVVGFVPKQPQEADVIEGEVIRRAA